MVPAPRRAAIAAAVVLALCACSPGTASTPASSPSPQTTPASSASSPAPGPGQAAGAQALAAYDGMWREMQAAGTTANWQDPLLARYASGKALATLVAGLRNASRQGLVIKGTLVTHPRVISLIPAANPAEAVVRDCSDDSRWLYYVAASGKLQNNVPGGHRLVEAVVTRSAGRWTVSQLAVHAEGTC